MGFSTGMMTGLLAANTALTQAQVHKNAVSNMDAQSNILESEIKSGLGDVEGKQEELEALQERRAEAQEMQMQSLNEAASQIGSAVTSEEDEGDSRKETMTVSDKAKDEAKDLHKKAPDNNVAPVDYKSGIHIGQHSSTNTAISPAFLEKLADDEQVATRYEKHLGSMAEIDRSTPGDTAAQRTWAVDANGRISHHTTVMSAEDAVAYEPIRQQIDAACRAAFGDAFAGAHVTVQTSERTATVPSAGVLIHAEA